MSIASWRLGLDGISPVYARGADGGSGSGVGGADFVEAFSRGLKVSIASESADGRDLVFDMSGVEAPVANALRRILLAEVPTMAIDMVYVFKNTGIIQDEVLSHRLGLVPLRADPRKMQFQEDPDQPTDQDTLVFKLNVRAAPHGSSAGAEAGGATASSAVALEQAVNLKEFADASEREGDVDGRYTKVYARELTWEAHGAQEEMFPGLADDVGAVEGDILVAKLAPGQTIVLEAHAIKGTGKTHAKWSPVSTAWYRLLPRISLDAARPFLGDEADELVSSCPAKVFDIEDGTSGPTRRGVVARPRDCTLCRECIRDPERAPRIKLEQVSDHFICE